MRKNLYRAKGADDTDKNVWYEGYYMQMNDTTYCFSEDYERAAREGKDPRHYYIVFDRMTDWGLPNRHFKADVRPETLCQHTGRYDKNKKSIYEWDIITVTHNGRTSYHLIEYREESAAFVFTQGEMYNHFDSWHPDCEFEVVGNKFDNPELVQRITQYTPESFMDKIGKEFSKQEEKQPLFIKIPGRSLSNIRAFLDDRGHSWMYKYDDCTGVLTLKKGYTITIKRVESGYEVTGDKGSKIYPSQKSVINDFIIPLFGNAYKEV